MSDETRHTAPQSDREQPKSDRDQPKIASYPPFSNRSGGQRVAASPDFSGRQLVEKRSASLRRNWLRRRDLKARDLSPAATDLLAEWSEARARLELGDERGEWGDRWQVAAQNSVARLAARLEGAAEPKFDPEAALRALMWEGPATVEDEPATPEFAPSELEALIEDELEPEEDESEIDFEALERHPPPPQETHKPKEPVSPLAWHSKKGRGGFVDINIW